ncbi:MBL fold metallo-hydrolase [Paenibacillus cremeus]|uniref:MBL fold metallo-hydrolase n=1 Tax=Paenibacillus cremeus TaxID=2163881 RepID=A0A559K9W3_9BACL|nr:MBL fold metallo-hydrolase [Paenibacillus cremeus]TVY08928.1 MBL fold metallo-hydrolase [Paenibacillus cremeus]
MPLSFTNEHIAVYQSRLYLMNSAVIQTDDLVLVTDPGYLPDEVSELRGYVDCIRGERPLYVLYTHSDFDHIAGYGAFPDAIHLAGEAFAERTDRAAAVREVMRYDDEYYIDRPYAIDYPRADVVCRAGETLKVGGTTLSFYDAGGHNPDGILTVVQPLGILIAGDYLSDIEFPFVYHSFAEYRSTLRTLEALAAAAGDTVRLQLLLPGHGSVTEDGAELQKRIRDSHAYLELVEAEAASESGERGAFDAFLDTQGYRFRLCMGRRHEDNLMVFKQERERESESGGVR